MSLLSNTIKRLYQSTHPRLATHKSAFSRWRKCRIEQMEPRQLLSVSVPALNVGAAYYEPHNGTDSVGNLIYISWDGGAPGTQLSDIIIDTHKNPSVPQDAAKSPVDGDMFFHTAPGGPLGTMAGVPLSIVEQTGVGSVSVDVANNSTLMTIHCTNFQANGRLVLRINVDEMRPGGIADPIVEGAEFDGSHFTAVFTAPHYQSTTVAGTFRDAYDDLSAKYGLNLPPDNYMPPGEIPEPVYTAGLGLTLQQRPLPITIAGNVFEDSNLNNQFNAGEPGIAGVTLTLLKEVDGNYVSTGKTAVTDDAGHYTFTDVLPDTYRVVETQPDGYLSVGAQAGTVGGATRGLVTTVDVLSSINLEGGDDSINNNFGETRPASISGHVYYDANNNGISEPGETPISGATVALLDSHGNPTGMSVVTDFQGFYKFDNLMPGTYSLAETQPAGYLDGLDAAGTAGGTAHNPGDSITAIALAAGAKAKDYDFGELLPASISGHVYYDANNNGIFEPGETPISGVTVALLDAHGNPTGMSVVTDFQGFYKFDNLMPGTYSLVETQPAGYLDGLDAAGTAGGTAHNPGDSITAIALAAGAKANDYDFGELLPASISGQVYVDTVRNNVLDTGEPLLAGVTIYLIDGSGTHIATTQTDENGAYLFTGLTPGVYGVEEVQPSGYFEGGDQVGSVGGALDGPDRIITVPLGPGVNGIHYNFCELLPAQISGYVFQDGPAIEVNKGDPLPNIPSIRDGKLTPDDLRLPGVIVQLCDGSGIPILDSLGNAITTVTNAEGYYEFKGLAPDDYSIVIVHPAGYIPAVDTAGSNGGLVVNRYAKLDPVLASTLAVDPQGSAIVKISLSAGDTAKQYNFSVVKITTPPDQPPENPPTNPPEHPPISGHPPTWPTFDPPRAPIGPSPFQYGISYGFPPIVVTQQLMGGSGSPPGYTWHLSVLDGGQPRNQNGAEFSVNPAAQIFDAETWAGANLNEGGTWTIADSNGVPVKTYHFGLSGATPVTGDWNGDGVSKIGVFINGLWFLDLNGDGRWDENDLWAKLGQQGDRPVSGDWDGDGKTDIGIFGPAWYGDKRALAVEPGLPDVKNTIRNRYKNIPPEPEDATIGYRTMKRTSAGKLRSDLIDHVFRFGGEHDQPVAGDWNGDGIYTIGVFRDGVWFLDMDGDGRWSQGDVMVEFGQEGDIPVVGDWTGDGISKLGVYRNGTFYLDTNNNHALDASDKVFALGGPGDKPFAGDFTGSGVDTVGVYHDGGGEAVSMPAPAAVSAGK